MSKSICRVADRRCEEKSIPFWRLGDFNFFERKNCGELYLKINNVYAIEIPKGSKEGLARLIQCYDADAEVTPVSVVADLCIVDEIEGEE